APCPPPTQWANLASSFTSPTLPVASILFFSSSVEMMLIALGGGWIVVSGFALLRLPMDFSQINSKIRTLARFGVPRIPGDFVQLLLFAMPGILIAHSADIRLAGIVAFGIAALG